MVQLILVYINFLIGSLIMLSTGLMTMLILKTLRHFYRDPEYSSARVFLSDSTTFALKLAVVSLIIYGVIGSIAGLGMWSGVIPEASLMRREVPAMFALLVTLTATNFFRVLSNVTEKEQ